MKLIHQRGTMDCGIASAAMLCGINYNKADELDPNPTAERGLYVREFLDICKKAGFDIKVKKPHPIPLKYANLPNKCALIIRKLNKKFGHFVCYENGKIYDPEFDRPVNVRNYKRNWWLIIRIFELS